MLSPAEIPSLVRRVLLGPKQNDFDVVEPQRLDRQRLLNEGYPHQPVQPRPANEDAPRRHWQAPQERRKPQQRRHTGAAERLRGAEAEAMLDALFAQGTDEVLSLSQYGTETADIGA